METTEVLTESSGHPNVKPEILQAIEYINRNYQEPISLDFIADYVHLSKYYFGRQFAQTRFSSGVQLSRAFRAVYQVTPGAFRRKKNAAHS